MQAIALAKHVFSAGSKLQRAVPEERVVNKVRKLDLVHTAFLKLKLKGVLCAPQDGAMMWGFTVSDDDGAMVTLYCSDRQLRDAWVLTVNSSARSFVQPLHLGDSYVVDYDSPLGTGLFAVVLRAEERSTRAS